MKVGETEEFSDAHITHVEMELFMMQGKNRTPDFSPMKLYFLLIV